MLGEISLYNELQLEDKLKSIIHGLELRLDYNRVLEFKSEQFRLHIPTSIRNEFRDTFLRAGIDDEDLHIRVFSPRSYFGDYLAYSIPPNRIRFEISFFFQEALPQLKNKSDAKDVVLIGNRISKSKKNNNRWRGELPVVAALAGLENIVVLPEFYRVKSNALAAIFDARNGCLIYYAQMPPGPNGELPFGESVFEQVLDVLVKLKSQPPGEESTLHYFFRPISDEDATLVRLKIDEWWQLI